MRLLGIVVLLPIVLAVFLIPFSTARSAQDCDLNMIPTPTYPPGVLVQRYVISEEECAELTARAQSEDDEDLPLAIIIPLSIIIPLAVLLLFSLIKPRGGGH